MKKGMILLLSVILTILFAMLVSAGNPGNSTQCGDINESRTNKTVELTQNVDSAGSCFTVNTSGVTIDCKGFNITFATTAAGNGIGLVKTNTTEVTVLNCNIHNGAALAGDGVNSDSANFSNFLFKNNTVTLNFTGDGMELTSDSDKNSRNVTILSNIFNVSGGNGLYFEYMNSSNVSNNIILNNDTSSDGIQLSDSVINSTFENNTLTMHSNVTSAGAAGLWIGSSSDHNSFRDNIIFVTDMNAVEISVANNNTFFENNFTTRGGTANSRATVSILGGSRNNTFINDIIEQRIGDGVEFNTTGSRSNTFLNVSFNRSSIQLGASLSGALVVQWYVKLNVSDASDNALDNVNVTFFNGSTLDVNHTFSAVTGLTENVPITEFTHTSSGPQYETNHNITIQRNGYIPNSTLITLNATNSTLINFNLTTHCGVITTDFTMGHNAESRGTCFEIETSGVTLDCAGYTINYSVVAGNEGQGINITSADNVTIRNCNIVEGNITSGSSIALQMWTSNGSSIINNTITTRNTSSIGMNISNVTSSTFDLNTITVNGSSAEGILLVDASNQNTVSGSTIVSNTTTLSIATTHNTVTNNSLVSSDGGTLSLTGAHNVLSFNVYNVTTGSSSNIASVDADNNTLTSFTMYNTGTGSDIVVSNNAHTTVINGTFNITSVSASGGESHSDPLIAAHGNYLVIQEYLKVTVIDLQSAVVADANVTANYSNGTIEQTALTASDGTIQLTLTARTVGSDDGTTVLTPHNVSAVASGKGVNDTTNISIASNRSITLQVPINAAEEDSSSSSSSSAGGGPATGSAGGISNSANSLEKKTWTSIEAGESATVDVKNSAEIGVKKLSFDVSESVYGVVVQIKKLTGFPSSIGNFPNELYRALEIKETNLAEGLSNGIDVDFVVSKEWLRENQISSADVALFRFEDNKWIELATTVGEDDGTYIHYSATTPGLSYFAIGVREGAQPLADLNEDGIVDSQDYDIREEQNQQEAQELEAVPEDSSSSAMWWWIIGAIVVIGLIVGIMYWRKNQS